VSGNRQRQSEEPIRFTGETDRVYVGTQKEYRAYLDLRAQNGLPDVDPMAAYYKRDQAMTSALPRDATTPPSWEWWPMFDQMGFQ